MKLEKVSLEFGRADNKELDMKIVVAETIEENNT